MTTIFPRTKKHAASSSSGTSALDSNSTQRAYVGRTEEVHVEGYNKATRQWIGRTTQNKTLNFTDAQLPEPREGQHAGRTLF